MPVDVEAFRAEVRAFVAEHGIPMRGEGLRVPRDDAEEAAIRGWLRSLYTAGYLGGGWPEAWGGRFRVVCFAQAPLETDIGLDPFLADVAWSWLVDALDARGARYIAASGTATKILSTGFGELARQGDGAQIEVRASWTPLDAAVGPHVEGWGELLCMLAGLPPRSEGVTALPRRRTKRG